MRFHTLYSLIKIKLNLITHNTYTTLIQQYTTIFIIFSIFLIKIIEGVLKGILGSL